MPEKGRVTWLMPEQPAWLPERPKRRLPSVPERARWFGVRAGELAGSASLGRLTAAMEVAAATPTAGRDAARAVAEGVAALRRRDRDSKGSRRAAVVVDAGGRVMRASMGRQEHESIGRLGPTVTLREIGEEAAYLAVRIDRAATAHLDLESIRVARWDLDDGRLSIVEASGVSRRDDLVVARITRPGVYRAVGLPRHPWLVSAIATLALHWPWVRSEGQLRERIPGWDEGPGVLPKVCQLILCAGGLVEAAADGRLLDLGLGVPPDLPDGFGGDLCELCLGGMLGIGGLGAGDLFDPPEIHLVDRPPTPTWRPCPSWHPLGPAPGVGFWGIGRVTQLDVHPDDGDTLVAATAGGGVWRTDDAGDHWRPLMRDEPTLTMGAVVFAPSDPDVIYAASGEDGGGFNPAWPGVGLYRSGDGGATWRLMSPVASTRFSALVVHPTLPGTVYVAGDQGLHKSTDGGVTWIANPGLGALLAGRVTDVVIAHDEPARVYAALRDDGVYRSDTAGEVVGGATAFTRLGNAGQLPTGVAAGWVKLAIGRDGVHGSDFLVAKMGDQGSRIFTTADGGTTWTERAANVATVSFDEWASLIAVSPDDERRLYAGAAGQLKRSDDGGATWTSIAAGIHPDQQDFAFDPGDADRVYLANDGGVYRSADAGATWVFASGDMSTTQLYDLDICQRDLGVVACGAQDNGIYYRTGGGVWRNLPFGWDGTQASIDPTDPQIVYFSGQNGIDNANLSRSTDGGVTVTALGAAGLSGTSPWVTIIALDPTDPIVNPAANRRLFVCGTNRLFRSTNGGASWSAVVGAGNAPFTTVGEISVLEFAPGDPTILYLATTTGALYRGTAGGATAGDWTRVDTPGSEADAMFPNTRIAALAINAKDADDVWVAFAGNGVSTTARPGGVLNPLGISHLFRSRDAGANWEDASGRFVPLHLPDVPTSAVAVEDRDPEVAYCGTDVGVFRTADGGATWTSFREGLPRSPVTELRLHRSGRRLFAATMGRGVHWYAL